MSEYVKNAGELTSIQNEKPHKRKNKRSKIVSVKKNTYDGEEINGEIREPTLEELAESEKVENIYVLKSGRIKKKEKFAKILESTKLDLVLKDINRNKEYLTRWKTNRSEWKFEKLRQISIQLSMFDKDKITDKLWPTALEYLSSSKGQSKNKIIELAEMQIGKSDKEIEETENNEIINSTRYRRAREILQSFD